MDLTQQLRGCLLGGAIGDALGAPIEFMRLSEIRQRFGLEGPADFVKGEYPLQGLREDHKHVWWYGPLGLPPPPPDLLPLRPLGEGGLWQFRVPTSWPPGSEEV